MAWGINGIVGDVNQLSDAVNNMASAGNGNFFCFDDFFFLFFPFPPCTNIVVGDLGSAGTAQDAYNSFNDYTGQVCSILLHYNDF